MRAMDPMVVAITHRDTTVSMDIKMRRGMTIIMDIMIKDTAVTFCEY